MPISSDKFRVQLDFTPEAYQELEALKGRLQANSKAEVVRCAMRVLQWVLDAQDHGKILEEFDGRQREVIFGFLPRPRKAVAAD